MNWASPGPAAVAEPWVGPAQTPPVSDHDFRRFQALIHRESGIWLSPVKKPLLQGRLARRLRELGVSSWDAYHARVIDDGTERVRMLDAITTNETHFFREARHWELLVEQILPAWRAEAEAGRRPKRIRAWSAACSTGEEPCTMAMVLLGALPRGWELEVLGSDLSTRALEQARRAVWPFEKSKEIPPSYLEAFMLRGIGEQAGTMKAGPEIRSVVTHRRLNLTDVAYPALGSFDLVFCRNVLIYFDRQTRERVVDQLLGHLGPDGYLFLGHAESLTGVSTRVRAVHPTVYAAAAGDRR